MLNFLFGNVETVLPKFLQERKIKPDVVFIDPARRGCDRKVIETLLELKPQKIVYVSCNPASFARDLAILEKNYEMKKICLVDMFPSTSHIECCSVLSLKNSIQ